MRIGVIGTGYVGLVTGTCFAQMGNDVICMDVDADKVTKLKGGSIPIYEPGLEEMVHDNQKQGRLEFTTSLRETVDRSKIIFIAVGTPPGENGSADVRHVIEAATSIAEVMEDYRIICNKSTVPVGTGQKVRSVMATALKKRGLTTSFDIVSNPEFLKEGSAISDCMRPDRIVIGVEAERPKSMMEKLYEPFVRNGHAVYFMDVASAEMTKYAANAMLATRISFINEVAALCERVGANVDQVRRGIGSDRRIGMDFLYAGLGYGGSCLPKDVSALVHLGEQFDTPLTILNAVEGVNQRQREKPFKLITEHFGHQLHGLSFGLWGLAFKPETDDLREAPALQLIESLLQAGASVTAYDPVAMPATQKLLGPRPNLRFVEQQYDAVEGVDALCLITEWKSFREPNFQKMKKLMKSPVIFDGRNQYRPEDMAGLGFLYFSIGRPTRNL